MTLSKPRWNPALTTIAFLLSLLATAGLLSWVTHIGSDTDETLVSSRGFRIWVATAAIALVAFADTLVAGIRELGSDRQRSRSPSLRVYAPLYLVFAVIVVVALRVGGDARPHVGVHYWTAVSLALLLLGIAAGGPWIVSVWASHGVMSDARSTIAGFPAADSTSSRVTELDDMLAELLDVRKRITAAVGRLLVLVLGAVLLSAALRAALVPRFTSENEFPSSAVLIYGAFFTIVLSLAVLPLMLAWRRTATMLVDRAYPLRVATSADEAAARDRLRHALGLDASVLASPATLSSLLAPLVTSALAVFLPQIGG